MPYPFALGGTLLRAQRSGLSTSFCRYKSITAAIEKGRSSGPGRFSSARPRTPFGDDRPRTSFREDRPRTSSRDDRPRTSFRDDDDSTRPRPSRPSRSGSSIGARRRRWENDDGPRAPRQDSDVDRRIRDDDRRTRDDDTRFSPRSPGASSSRGTRSDRRSAPADVTSFRDRSGRDRSDRDGGRNRNDRDRSDRDRPDRPDRPDRSDRSDRNDRNDRDRNDRPRDRDDRPTRTNDFPRPLRKTERRLESRLHQTPEHTRDARVDPRDSRPNASYGRNSSSSGRSDPGPDSLPYTTAASDFIYGYSSVLAAIKANRRQFYRLYVAQRGATRDAVLASAKAAKLRDITVHVGDEYARAMDKASSGRPHNGFILEASPLPVPPITELLPASKEASTFSVTLGSQSLEDRKINGTQTTYPYRSASWRHPLILYVDGVLDEGNLGAIARSAYVLGVDALVTPSRQSAPWSHIALKASAGAAEAVPIFKVDAPAEFLGKSARAGWRIYASDAIPAVPATSLPAASPSPPPSSSESDAETGADVDADANADADSATPTTPTTTTLPQPDSAIAGVVYTFARSPKRLPAGHSPVSEHPTILMMGAEGSGLRTSLLNLAHYKVGIQQGRETDEVGVDSLNVSVAASLLCFEALKRPVERVRDEAEVLF